MPPPAPPAPLSAPAPTSKNIVAFAGGDAESERRERLLLGLLVWDREPATLAVVTALRVWEATLGRVDVCGGTERSTLDSEKRGDPDGDVEADTCADKDAELDAEAETLWLRVGLLLGESACVDEAAPGNDEGVATPPEDFD